MNKGRLRGAEKDQSHGAGQSDLITNFPFLSPEQYTKCMKDMVFESEFFPLITLVLETALKEKLRD